MFKSMRYFILVSQVLAALLFTILPGCKSQATDSNLGFQVAPRAEDAVISLYLMPRDTAGNIISENGMLSVKMWEKTSSNPPATGALIGKWDNLDLSDLTFSTGKGTLVNLAPNDAFMGKTGQVAYIELNITGKGNAGPATGIVILGDLPACCGSGQAG